MLNLMLHCMENPTKQIRAYRIVQEQLVNLRGLTYLFEYNINFCKIKFHLQIIFSCEAVNE